MTATDTVVVIGTGQAALQLATSLRDAGHTGPITLIGDEPGWPYQRPPLSKSYLSGKTGIDGLSLRAPEFYAQRDIEVVRGQRVASIDRPGGAVEDQDGRRYGYDHLVIATGARNRPLPVPGAGLDGVVYLRTLADADALRRRLDGAGAVAVVGAGFIGMEFAAFATARNLRVNVIEAAGRPMARVLSDPMSAFFRRAHERAGVGFAFDTAVAGVTGRDGRATGIDAGDGRWFPADLVVAAVGVVPNAELAAAAGLPVADGIVVDERLSTADPAISAIGDCAAFPHAHLSGAMTRLESVQNAIDQARCVAARLAGRPEPFRAVPWFWSDQGPWKLQIAGLAAGATRAILRGDPSSGAFSVFRFDGDRLRAVESVNRGADHMLGRRLLASGAALRPEQAADPAFDLKAFAR